MRICSQPDCGAPHEAKGLCEKHYQRLRHHGDPTHLAPPRNAEKLLWIERVLSREATGECVDWPWARDSAGYGLLQQPSNVPARVHVLVLERAAGPRPGTDARRAVALHSCDRPICCAPWHLRWGSQSENVRESWARTRRVGA